MLHVSPFQSLDNTVVSILFIKVSPNENQDVLRGKRCLRSRFHSHFVSKRTNDFQACLGAIFDLLSSCSQCCRSTSQNWSRLFVTQLVKIRLSKKNNFKMTSSNFNFIDEHKMILYLCIGLYWNHPCHYRFLKLHTLKEQRRSYAWLYVLHFDKPIQAPFCFFVINKPNCMFSRKIKDKYH